MCLGNEPRTLYLYGGASQAQWSILDAVYDGPFDRVNYAYQPTIMQEVPSIENGAIKITPIEAKLNMIYADVNGDPAILVTGSQVFPSGCRSADCAVTWDGTSALTIDQQEITYRFKPGILWSDGQPLTADDSLFSYEVAANPATTVNRLAISRTSEYQKTDDQTIVWKGIPGYISPDPIAYFFLPLPRHAYKDIPVEDLASSDAATKPLGWGPYQLESWVTGERITLVANPNYYQSAEGLPRFQRVNFKFLGAQSDNNLYALANGQCDVIADTTLLEEQMFSVRNMELEGVLDAKVALGPEIEYLMFGVTHTVEEGLESAKSFLADPQTRQAIYACIDRDELNHQLFNSLNQPASGFFPPDHMAFLESTSGFDTDNGAQLLEAAGWIDEDQNPDTPRVSSGVEGVPNGYPLTLSYLTTNDPVRVETANMIQSNLKACGVQVNIRAMEPGELYAPGPEGKIFGRNFELAQFSWSSGMNSPCALFTTAQIPSAENQWMGMNITGFSDPAFDQACAVANALTPDDAGFIAAQQAVQEQFVQSMPAVPLYYQAHVSAATPEICGLMPSSSARSEFWNIEKWSGAGNCPADE